MKYRLAISAVVALAIGAPSAAVGANPRTYHCGASLPAVSGRSFSWADAGVGATAGTGTVFALLGTGLLVSRSRQSLPDHYR